MLNRAADLIENGSWRSPYRLVMVDEMQDASHARARLVRALVKSPGVLLFAVGDDWQSINRFAGADLSVMTRFDDWFGTATTLRLQRTFRSPQSICDVSSAFISKNPGQLLKRVVSDQPEYPPAVTAVAVRSNTEYAAVINRYLTALDRALGAGTIPTGRDGRTSVYILGRYRKVNEAVQPVLDRDWVNLDVRFNTMHGEG
jgi:DNA helicase-4